MEQFKAPSPLSLTANPADNRCSWEQSFGRNIVTSGDKDEQGKIDILVHHIKEEPEMLSEGQEENQLCVQQETNSAACSVKCEDEEEKPQTSQLHWRQLTEMNMKEEPSTYSLNELMKRQTVGINSKTPESSQNPDPSSLVLRCPDGTESDSSLTDDSNEYDTEADFVSTSKKRKMTDSSKKASKTQICSKIQVKVTSECVGGKKASLSADSKQKANSGEKPFKCDVCSKCIINKHQLKSHMKIHTGEKPFKCEVCSRCFIQNSHLKLHMKIHTGENPFKCDICSKCFIQKSDLDKHIRIHTGEKPFKCDQCSKWFNQKQNLQLHIRTHTGEKPFKCDVSSKCFTRNATLQSHVRMHKGEKPFKCDVCCKCFTRKVHLQSHGRMHKRENLVLGSIPVQY